MIKKWHDFLSGAKLNAIFGWMALGSLAISLTRMALGDKGSFWDGVVAASAFWCALLCWGAYAEAKRKEAKDA